MIENGLDVRSVGLAVGSPVLASLRQQVVDLASFPGVLDTVQGAAQAVLQRGWAILLPTADERAKTLSSLLPGTGKLTVCHSKFSASFARFSIIS